MNNTNWLIFAAALSLAAPAAAQVAPSGAGQLSPAQRPEVITRSALSRQSIDLTEMEIQMLYDRRMELAQRRNRLSDVLGDTLAKFSDNSPQAVEARRSLEQVAKEYDAIQSKLEALISDREERESGPGRRLLRPVAVQLQNATVRQAAEALSQATKLSIRVEGEIPNDTRLTVQARDVTLGAVLEAIGRQANLRLAPSDKGVVISPWPMVEINGQQQVFRGRLAPWSSDWGVLPGYPSRDGWVFPGEADAADLPYSIFAPLPGNPAAMTPTQSGVGVAPLPEPRAGGMNPASDPNVGAPVYPGSRSVRGIPSAAMAISMASLGDRSFAVSEPGQGTEGQPGAWITVYRIEGTQLKKIATGFHPLRSSSLHRGKSMGIPGMMPLADPNVNAPATTPGVPTSNTPGGLQPAPVAPPGGLPPPSGVPSVPTATLPAPATLPGNTALKPVAPRLKKSQDPKRK